MRDHRKAEEIAAQRMQLLSPLLAKDLDLAKARKLKTEICAQTGISERTLRRYLAQYRKTGFGGLKPKGKGERLNRDAIPAHILEQAILLRREVPGRSVAQIIQILEWEGLAEPGRIKRSTCRRNWPRKATAPARCVCTRIPAWPQGGTSIGTATSSGIQISSMVHIYPSARMAPRSKSTWSALWTTPPVSSCTESSIPPWINSS